MTLSKLLKPVLRGTIALCVAVIATAAHSAENSHAQGELNVLVVGEDARDDAISRHSAVFRTVLRSLIQQVNAQGYTVWDETHKTMAWLSSDWDGGYSEEVLIDIVQGIDDPSIDLIVMFSFNRSILDENGAPTLSAVLEGKVLRVVDGEHLASSTAMSSWAQPAQCNPQCELDIIAKDAERLSLSMGGSLTRQLAIVLRGDGYASKPNEAVADEPLVLSTYTLAFSKFSGQQIILLEDYLIALPYYVDHEYLISIADATELSLKTTTGSRQLMGDLLRMLNSTGLQADVSFLANTFFIENSVNKVRRVRGPPDGF